MSVLCLVPTPLRAQRAARRLCDAQGGILFGTRVGTLDAVAAGLLAAGGDRRPVLTPLAEALMALEAGAAAGKPFGRLAPEDGLARALVAAVAELRRGELEPDEVRAAASELGGRRGERLRVLGEVLAGHAARRAALGALDRTEALRAAREALGRGAASDEVRGLDLLILEGFRALPPAAFDLVAALAWRATRTQVRIPFFPERADASGSAEALLRSVESLHETAARRELSVALEDLDGGRSPRLARVLRVVAAGPGGGPDGEGGLLWAAPGPGEEGEAEAVAGAVRRLLDRGFLPEDVVVIAADADRAAPALERAFAALGLPFAAGRGAPLAALPVVRAVRTAYQAALDGGRGAFEALAGSPYLRLGLPPDKLGLWLDRAGALPGRVDPEAALRARAAALTASRAAPERAGLERAASALASARAALAPLAADGTARQHAAGLRGFLQAAGARRRAARAAPDLARRDLAALSRVEETADDLVRALTLLGRGEERLPAGGWSALLGFALGRAPSPPAAEPAAGAVELWPLAEAPGLSARAAVLVGCGRGAFPAVPATDALLGDEERAALNRAARRQAVASGPARRAEALHAAFCALAVGREALALAWPGPGPEGEGAGPAPLAAEALAVGGALAWGGAPGEAEGSPGETLPRGGAPWDAEGSRWEDGPETPTSAAACLRAAARAARAERAGEAEGEVAAVAGILAAVACASPVLAERASHALARGAVEAERAASVLARHASPASGLVPPSLLPELRRALPEEWTPSQLETQARCPWRLFADVALGLREPEAGDLDIDPRDEGRLVHAVLERFFRARLARGAGPLRGAPEELDEVSAAAEVLFTAYQAAGQVGDPAVWAARRGAVLRSLRRVVAAEPEASGGLTPALLEYRFGGDAPAPPLVFGEGDDEVRLQGRLDRVDADAGRLLLLDYKNARASSAWKEKLEEEALGETNFQVPAYLMAAARALPGRERLEASYLLLRSAERLAPFASAAGAPLWAVDPAARQAARDAGARPFADAVVGAVRRIRAGELPVASRDCTGCPHGAACRFEDVAEAEP